LVKRPDPLLVTQWELAAPPGGEAVGARQAEGGASACAPRPPTDGSR
jgi:hypothetical protein